MFKEMVSVGQLYNYAIPMEQAIRDELYEISLSFDKSSTTQYLYISPFNITNSSPYDINGITITVNFIDENDVVVGKGYLLSYDNIKAGKSVSTQKVFCDTHFTHISYSYSFTVQTTAYYYECDDVIIPRIQYSWDGKIKENGEFAEGQPIFELQNLYSGWEMNTSWDKTLYVPVLKFDVKNVGTGMAESIVVRVVFTNEATKQVWDEETTYVIGTSNSPLKPGFSKKTFVYASVGYNSKVTPPDLKAEIFINDELVETITIGQ